MKNVDGPAVRLVDELDDDVVDGLPDEVQLALVGIARRGPGGPVGVGGYHGDGGAGGDAGARPGSSVRPEGRQDGLVVTGYGSLARSQDRAHDIIESLIATGEP